jgi:hypothetical protein
VRRAFAQLLNTFAAILAAPMSQVHPSSKLIVLSCAALLYQPSEQTMLNESGLIRSLHALMTARDSVRDEQPSRSSTARAVVVAARHLFLQLARVVLTWRTDETNKTMDNSSQSQPLQQQVLSCVFDAIDQLVPAAATAANPTEATGDNERDSALHAYLLLLHSLIHTRAVRVAASSSSNVSTLLRLLHMQTHLIDSSDGQGSNLLHSESVGADIDSTLLPISLRIQRILLRLLRHILARSGPVSTQAQAVETPLFTSDAKQRAFVAALFDRIGALLTAKQSICHGSSTDSSKASSSTDSEHKEAEHKETEEKSELTAASPASVSSPSPSLSPSAVPSASPLPGATSATGTPEDSICTLTVHNTGEEAGAQFAATLYANCRVSHDNTAAHSHNARPRPSLFVVFADLFVLPFLCAFLRILSNRCRKVTTVSPRVFVRLRAAKETGVRSWPAVPARCC